MLFRLESGKDIFELNPELKAIGEFANLTSRQMTYVALTADYGSPFRKLPAEDAKFQSALEAGYKLEKGTLRLDINGRNLVSGKVANVEAGIRKYMTLQKDDDREAWAALKVLISQITELNNKKDKTVAELEKAIKFTKELTALMETKRKIEEILNIRSEDFSAISSVDTDMVREEELSTLDLYNENNAE